MPRLTKPDDCLRLPVTVYAARQAHERSLALSREIGDKAAVGVALRNIASLEFNTGELNSPKTRYQDGLAIARNLETKVKSRETWLGWLPWCRFGEIFQRRNVYGGRVSRLIDG